MLLPNNGRIVIVDDLINEAQPLITIFSKKRIPFNYYQGTRITDFPENPNENCLRILFLDLNIFETNQDPKTVISALHPIIKRIVPDNPSPYVLIIWSKKTKDYADELEEHFNNKLQSKKPAKTIFLNKNKYFDLFEGGIWKEKEDSLDSISVDLKLELENISVLKALIGWENIVHEKTNETIGEFSSFYPINPDWDKNTKSIIFHLAKSVAGDDDIETLDNKQKLAKALGNINSFLSDKVETEINSKNLEEILDIKDPEYDKQRKKDGLTIKIKSRINEKLHVSNRLFNVTDFEQGHIYPIKDYDQHLDRIIWSKIFSPENPSKLDEIRINSSLIQLDITPVCDYSQDKNYVRFLYGIITKHEHSKYFKSQFYFCSPILNIFGEEKILVFDFRFIKTFTKKEIIEKGIIPSFKLRKEICTDIQSQLANQINRPGISNL